MTLREAVRQAIEHLERHHVSNARLQVEVLLSHILSVEKTYIYTHDERVLSEEQSQALETALYDRISGVPLQYIVGRQEFYGRNFIVTPAVLIPRPETEHVIETVLELAERDASGRIIDVGTGSGCIAVTLAAEMPRANVFASDISEPALQIAKQNAASLDVRVGFVAMDVLDGVTGPFNFIVSNPPYVKPGDLGRLQLEVREHEPHVALFSPGDELGVYRRLIPDAQTRLTPGGYLLLEIGIGMEERVLSLFGPGWKHLPTKPDLQGIPRTIVAQKV